MLISAVVKKFSGKGGWHYVEVPENIYQEFVTNALIMLGGFRSVPLKVRLGSSIWQTSIFPIKGGVKIIGIKTGIRKKENIAEGDRVKLDIQLRFL